MGGEVCCLAVGVSKEKRRGSARRFLVVFVVFVFLMLLLAHHCVWKLVAVKRMISIKALKTTTKLPIYFLNLDRSLARRLHMENTFGEWGTLIRQPAVDGLNFTDLEANVDLGGLDLAEYLKAVRASAPGELAVAASAYKAIKSAFDSGHRAMLLFEDDMSDLLAPHWRMSVDEVVDAADDLYPEWDVIQLHVTAYGSQRRVFHSWKKQPNLPFVDRGNFVVWGGGAQIFSRDGMSKFLTRFRGEGGKFSCLREAQLDKKFLCVADYLYFVTQDENWKALLKVPPMFTYQLNEGSTLVRHLPSEDSKATAAIASDKVNSDHFLGHYRCVFDSLQANIEAKAAAEAANDLGNSELRMTDLRYFRQNIELAGKPYVE